MKKYWYPIIILIFLVVGIVDGAVIEHSLNIMFTWILIGIWIAYNIGVLKKVHKIRTYSTPHNSGLLILSTLCIGVFYSFWGRYTALLSGNITGLDGFYFSLWTLIIATPYLIYGMLLLRLTFKKYYSVYFGTKSVVARKFGMVTIISLLIIELILFLTRIGVDDSTSVDLQRNYNGLNIPILVFSIYITYLFIRYGLIQRSVSISDLSPDYINRRLSAAERVANQNSIAARNAEANAEKIRRKRQRAEKERQLRAKQQAKKRAEEEQRRRIEVERRRRVEEERQRKRSDDERKRRAQDEKRRRIEAQRGKKYEEDRRKKLEEQRNRQREMQKRQQIASASKNRKQNVPTQKTKLSKGTIKKYESMRPNSSIISADDFKCIFCFNLPKYPQDKNRGIVLCPNCKHPAHADEFKNWAHNSPLCSRCDTEIPAYFRRNPTVIPVKDYLEAAKYLIKKEKNG